MGITYGDVITVNVELGWHIWHQFSASKMNGIIYRSLGRTMPYIHDKTLKTMKR